MSNHLDLGLLFDLQEANRSGSVVDTLAASPPCAEFSAATCGACEQCGYHVGHHPDCLLFDDPPTAEPGPFDEGHRHHLP